MTKTLFALGGSVVLLGIAVWVLAHGDAVPSRGPAGSEAESGEPLVFFCAASNRAVIEAIVADYTAETGTEIQLQFGPSQHLLASLEVSKQADLYLPADESYLQTARDKGLVAEILPIARMQGVVAVKKGNPKQLSNFQDLLRDEVHLVQASPDAAAIASVTRRELQAADLWEKLDAATEAYRTTVTDVANDILIGASDAGIVYDAVLHTYPDLEYVELPELREVASQVSVGVVATSAQPTRALHFARFISARDQGQIHYARFGFRTVPGDKWSDVPELSVFAGSMLRPAIEETITEFEEREGVRVSRVYDGCGILVAQMKAGQHPDAYFACDVEFMNQVADLFPERVDVSQNELVILVPKGNPQNISSLRDLTREGLRIGIGHEKQCAMGWITQNTFREGGVQQEIMANVAVQTPTGDMLVNQLRAGSLDAAVAYLSNAAGSADLLDAIRIQDISCSTAIQPWAVAAESPYPNLASRLFEAICSAESQEIFQAEGFRWQLSKKTDRQPETQ